MKIGRIERLDEFTDKKDHVKIAGTWGRLQEAPDGLSVGDIVRFKIVENDDPALLYKVECQTQKDRLREKMVENTHLNWLNWLIKRFKEINLTEGGSTE